MLFGENDGGVETAATDNLTTVKTKRRKILRNAYSDGWSKGFDLRGQEGVGIRCGIERH